VQDTKSPPYTASDFRFTTKGNAIYAIQMAWPSGRQAVIQSFGRNMLGEAVKSIYLLGYDAKLEFLQQSHSLHIQLPSQVPGKYAYGFRIVLQE
jgi:alpha-L-fucosidase